MVDSGELRSERTYIATDTAFVEWVEGKPYSKAADSDMLIRCNGGDSGRGRHSKSFRNPLKKTPEAKMCTILSKCQTQKEILPHNHTRRIKFSTYPRPSLI